MLSINGTYPVYVKYNGTDLTRIQMADGTKVWPVAYTLKLNPGKANATAQTQECLRGRSYIWPDCPYTLANYVFTGWLDSSGTTHASGDSFSDLSTTDGAVVEVTAQWKANTYVVQFVYRGNNDGSTGSMSNQTMTFDTPTALTKNAYTNNVKISFGGYADEIKVQMTFKGWTKTHYDTSPTLNGGTTLDVDYTDGQSVTNLASTNVSLVSLYTVWNAGSFVAPNCNTQRTGHTFTHWSSNLAGNLGIIYPGTTVTIPGTTTSATLLPNWSANKWTLYYDT